MTKKRGKNKPYYKRCDACSKEIKTKNRKCPCGGKLVRIVVKKLKPFILCKDWQTLAIGDTIKVSAGHGPESTVEDKDKTYKMNSSGMFQIYRILEDGILAVAITDGLTAGYEYIYMGEEKDGKYGVRLKPHKVYIKNPNL